MLLREEAAVIKDLSQTSSKKYVSITSFDEDNFRRGHLTQNYHFTTIHGHVRELELELTWSNPSIPKNLSNLTKLHTLILYINNTRERIPNFDVKLNCLVDLKILTTGAVIIPNMFTNFPSLTNLEILGQRRGKAPSFSEVPETIGSLKQLIYVMIRDVNLGLVPNEIGGLKSLQDLTLRNCNLTYLPESIGNLASLTSLDLSQNKLKTVPSSLTNIRSLHSIKLSYNFTLRTLPPSLLKLKGLFIGCQQCYNLNISDSEIGDDVQIFLTKDFRVSDSGYISINLIVKNIGSAPAGGYTIYKEKLLNPLTQVTLDESISVLINYYHLNRYYLTFRNKGGFTRLKLYELISEAHHQFYEGDKIFSEGPTALTFYDILDLTISSITYYPKERRLKVTIYPTY